MGVEGLLDILQDDSTQDRLSDAETVVHDLEELARCLEVAVRRTSKASGVWKSTRDSPSQCGMRP